jgi:hypothetical protein
VDRSRGSSESDERIPPGTPTPHDSHPGADAGDPGHAFRHTLRGASVLGTLFRGYSLVSLARPPATVRQPSGLSGTRRAGSSPHQKSPRACRSSSDDRVLVPATGPIRVRARERSRRCDRILASGWLGRIRKPYRSRMAGAVGTKQRSPRAKSRGLILFADDHQPPPRSRALQKDELPRLRSG